MNLCPNCGDPGPHKRLAVPQAMRYVCAACGTYWLVPETKNLTRAANVFAGLPVSLSLPDRSIRAGATDTAETLAPEYMELSRLRWSGGGAGLVLMDVVLQNDRVFGNRQSDQPSVDLEGCGCWRFPAQIVQVEALLRVTIRNVSSSPQSLRTLVLWGIRKEW